MSNSRTLKYFQSALAKWPKDNLRPHANFAETMQQRIQATPPTEAETNALLTLLENRYAHRYPLSKETYSPASDPEYYGRVKAEVEEAPTRSFLDRVYNRITGVVRWK